MNNMLAITGATGKKSGGYFAHVLSEHADEVNAMFDGNIRAVVRATSDTSALDCSTLHFEKCVGSVDDVEFLRQVFCGVDTVIHIAGIHWSREVAQAASSCHVRRLIMVHTTGIYSKYKQAGEEYRQIDRFVYKTCRENNIILTILRPTMIYGNKSDKNIITFIKMVDKLLFIPVVNGARYELQPVHYSDLGKAYYQVLINESTTANKDFILSGAEPITLRDMFSVIGENLGKKLHFINCPFQIAYAGSWIIYVLSLKKIDYREKVQRLCEPRTFPYEAATKAFAYAPMPFEKGIIDEIQAYLRSKQK